jgi:hypothetical protein
MQQHTMTDAMIDNGPHVVRVPTSFYWYDNDPFAVCMIIGDGSEDAISWTFDVDLLREGLKDSAGCGDVIIWSGDNILSCHLRSPDGSITIKFHKDAIEQFCSLIPAQIRYTVSDDEIFALLDNEC